MKKKKVQVTFTKKQWDLIENIKPELGDKDSTVVRNIVLAWLAEKSFISTTVKNKIGEKNDQE